MGLDEFGREVPGMPSNTSSFGEASGLNFRYNDEDDYYHEVKRGRYHAAIQNPTEIDHVVDTERMRGGDEDDLNDIRNYDDDSWGRKRRGGVSYHSRRLARPNHSPDSIRYESMHRKKKHHMSNFYAAEKRKNHPSQAYTDGPLLCQFVWHKEQSQLKSEKQQVHASQQAVAKVTQNQERIHEIAENEVNSESMLDSQSKGFDHSNQKDDADQDYLTYNKTYCLKYIRHFFNHHLDDMWFRQRYSPLEYRRFVENERNRARIEAVEIMKEVDASLDECNRTSGNEENESKSISSNSIPSFVMHARLGGGVKPLSSTAYIDSSPSRKRKYSISIDHPQYDAISDSGIPKSHLFSFLQNDSALYIMDVPNFVSDTHLYNALKEHSESDSFQIISEPVVGGVCTSVEDSGIQFGELLKGGTTNHKKISGHYLDRSVWAIFQSHQEKEKVLESLLKYQGHHSVHHDYYCNDERDHSQSKSFKYPKILELEIECSDPYGRTELDGDGRGGLLKENKEAGMNEPASIIPIRHVSVFVSSSSAVQTQSLAVLSAAISSRSRYSNDRKAAMDIAKRLDIARDIPMYSRLSCVLSKLFGNDILKMLQSGDYDSFELKDIAPYSNMSQFEQDFLDVTIAYLRRVHLFSFYNGCIISESIGSTLSGTHPTSTVHLRLHDADLILQKAREDNSEIYGDLSADSIVKHVPSDANESKDMLVMRLDASIAKAIDVFSSVDESGFTNPFIVNEIIDPLASEIESMEEKKKTSWLQDHSLIDEDQRARCSFHFCRKLFKDATFLTKHLLKKHGEHLRAEIAKCHDQYMMGWWEEDHQRPVPPVLVDCGPKFGLIERNLQDEKEPFVVDPEPELWRKEQERNRKKEEDENKYHESKEEKYNDSRRNIQESFGNDNFDDVDNMKDEKIELHFEHIQPSKKSKKKKKKLL